MKFTSLAITLLSASSVSGFRDQSQIKPNRDQRRFRSLEEVAESVELQSLVVPDCFVDNEKGQSVEEVSVQVTALPGEKNGLFKVKFQNDLYSEDPITSYAWCVDLSRYLDTGSFSMDIFSAYDADIHVGAVDKPANFPNLAWLINNVNVGDPWNGPEGCIGTVTWTEMQGAVWQIIDNGDEIAGGFDYYGDSYKPCIADQIADMALEYGDDYKLDCSDPDEQMPLIMVVDNDSTGEILNQVILTEVPLISLDGYCECPTPAPTDPTPSPTDEEKTPPPTPDDRVFTPAPDTPKPTPAPDTPAPTPETPAPTPETPAPTPETPAPTPETPAPTEETPAPTPETPAPTPETPAPTPETPAPTPTPAPDTPAPTPPPTKGSGSGDPHFKTWTGAKFDYHGECDLVLVDNPTFMNGLGLRVHIRTTRIKYFSYIERIAVQIGDDVLEFANDVDNFLINGEKVEPNRPHHKLYFAGLLVRRDAKAISIRIHDEGRQHRHDGSVAKIDFHHRKNGFPAVIVDGGLTDVFKGSLGLLGEWESGRRLARDGKTELNDEDATSFALEWQVRDHEPMLFQDARAPQWPTVCTPPEKMTNRLGWERMKAEAEKACAHWKEDMDDCIFDVIATRDVMVAEEGAIE